MATRTRKSPARKSPARKSPAKVTEPVTLSSVINSIATAKGTNAVKEGKALRSYIRGHFDDLTPRWKGLSDTKVNKDGNRYPPIPADLAAELIALRTKGVSSK